MEVQVPKSFELARVPLGSRVAAVSCALKHRGERTKSVTAKTAAAGPIEFIVLYN